MKPSDAKANPLKGEKVVALPAPSKKLKKLERCHQQQLRFSHLFPDIPTMSSSELLLRQHPPTAEEGERRLSGLLAQEDHMYPVVLVDVRTDEERAISMIPGAVSLRTFEKEIVHTLPPGTDVVTYCTIGYRSGLEARRLRDRYRLHETDQDELASIGRNCDRRIVKTRKVYSLDGIVPYTYARLDTSGTSKMKDQAREGSVEGQPPPLINPLSGQKTFRVHTFAPIWDNVDEPYEALHFTQPELSLKSAKVGLTVVVRSVQEAGYRCRKCAPRAPICRRTLQRRSRSKVTTYQAP